MGGEDFQCFLKDTEVFFVTWDHDGMNGTEVVHAMW